MIPSYRFGIDLGGTKIELAALDATGEIRLRRRVATPAGDYDATLVALATLVAEAERELSTRASVGVATPGSPSPLDGRMRNANSTCLNGRALKDDLERRLARPIRIAIKLLTHTLIEGCADKCFKILIMHKTILIRR